MVWATKKEIFSAVMRIILSHGYFIGEDVKEQAIMRPYPPLGLLYISSWLELHGYPNAVLDSTFISRATWQDAVFDRKPDLIALYVNLMTKVVLVELIEWIKGHNPETTVVLGGPDITYNIEEYLSTGADYLVVGEGEQTMLELVKAIENGNSYMDVAGIAFRDAQGDIVKTRVREKMKDLDDLPLPARDKIDLKVYLDTWKSFHGGSSISISTQRGCPYTCKWCSTAVYGQSYRRRSPAHVVSELKTLITMYAPDHFWFVDDVFTVSHKWLKGLAAALKEASIEISFECITRADRLNEEVLDIMKEMGCFRIWIGAESGSQHVIDLMDRRVEVTKVKSMILATQERGMQAGTFIMLGYPGETERDVLETMRYLKEAKPDHYTITIAYPIKGTSLYNQVEPLLENPAMDWKTNTDRDREFQRTYRRKYYEHAVRWVASEVALTRSRHANLVSGPKVLLKSKSLYSRLGMLWERMRS